MTFSLSVSVSSSPLTVTVCVLFQLPVVKVRLAGDTVAAPVSSEVTVTVTCPLGCVASFTVKVSKPASPTPMLVRLNTRLAVSSSVTVSVSVSSSPLTVTVCVLFQLPVVKVRLAGDTVAAPVSSEVTVTVTLPLGSVASFTVKVPLPASPTLMFERLNTRLAVSVARVTVTWYVSVVVVSSAVTSTVMMLSPSARSTVPSVSSVPSSLITGSAALGSVVSAVTIVEVTLFATLAV